MADTLAANSSLPLIALINRAGERVLPADSGPACFDDVPPLPALGRWYYNGLASCSAPALPLPICACTLHCTLTYKADA
jgi:hypothetical protein